MTGKKLHCTIVEVGCDDAGAETLRVTGTRRLPWADPMIAQLVTKYRLRAALDDSLQFLESEASHSVERLKPKVSPLPRSARFNVPPLSNSGPDSSRWPE